MSSRLFQRVREELGLAYCGVHVPVVPRRLGHARRLRRHGAGDRAATRSTRSERAARGSPRRASRRRSSRRARASSRGRSRCRSRACRRGCIACAGVELYGEPYRTLDEMLALIDAITPEQVADVARRVLRTRATDRRDASARATHSDDASRPRQRLPTLNLSTDPMKIGVPKEIKTNENRIALVPAGAEALVAAGHHGAGRDGCGCRQRLRGRGTTRRSARRSRPTPTTVWRDSRHDHEGEGADRARVAAHADAAS